MNWKNLKKAWQESGDERWIQHPKGGNQDDGQLQAIIESEKHERRASIGALYRRFTDQLIGSF